MANNKLHILHISAQRPGHSGSGVFLQAMIREAAACGHDQHVIVGGPADISAHEIAPLLSEQLSVLAFPSTERPFEVPGMSDAMPYPSTAYSKMLPEQVDAYRVGFRDIMQTVKETFQPDIVHVHHLWMVAAIAREVFSDRPVIASAHNTGLRQLQSAGHLAEHVLAGVRQLDSICVLTAESERHTMQAYGVEQNRITVTGAGYRNELFNRRDRSREDLLADLRGHGIELDSNKALLVYVGRLSTPKGIPWLLQAVEQLQHPDAPEFQLVLVGAAGSGSDGEQVAAAAHAAVSHVVCTGAQPQERVATLLQCAHAFVLPSLYEGLPLVMLEALACGSTAIVSALPTIESWLPPEWLQAGYVKFVPKLQTTGTDTPIAADEDRYTRDLARVLFETLQQQRTTSSIAAQCQALQAHSWSGVFNRYQSIYHECLRARRNNQVSYPLNKVKRCHQAIHFVAIALLSWFTMMIVHETGHLLHALLSGGTIKKVILHPLEFSQTVLDKNPHPFFVVWGGPIWGCMIPLFLWWLTSFCKWVYVHLIRFFAGFCLLANGVYLGMGSFDKIGDAGDLLDYGTPSWVLILFGLVSSATGLFLWNGLGSQFGIGKDNKEIDAKSTWGISILLTCIVGLEFLLF